MFDVSGRAMERRTGAMVARPLGTVKAIFVASASVCDESRGFGVPI
jgi:hypothetical protein